MFYEHMLWNLAAAIRKQYKNYSTCLETVEQFTEQEKLQDIKNMPICIVLCK